MKILSITSVFLLVRWEAKEDEPEMIRVTAMHAADLRKMMELHYEIYSHIYARVAGGIARNMLRVNGTQWV